MDDNTGGWVLVGGLILVGFFLGGAFTRAMLDNVIDLGNEAQPLVEQCEIKIPRDMNCKLIAVIDEENK